MYCQNCGREIDTTEMFTSPRALDQGGDGSTEFNITGSCEHCGVRNNLSLNDYKQDSLE